MAKTKNTPPAGKNDDNPTGGIVTSDENSTLAAALKKIGHETLKRNPNLSAVYVTCDGTSFAEKSDACNHAKTLPDKTVLTIERETIE